MTAHRYLLFIAVCLTLTTAPAYTAAQADSTVTVAGVLKAADCPLSQKQATVLRSFKVGDSFEGIYDRVYDTLNEKQMMTLTKWLGRWDGYGEWHKTPRYLHWILLMENNGYPVTTEQIHELRKRPQKPPLPTPESIKNPDTSRKTLDEILSPEQLKVVRDANSLRADRNVPHNSNRPVASAPAGDPSVIIVAFQRELTPAGMMLTETQQEQMTAGFNHQNPRDLRGVLSVLSSDQKKFFIAKYRENLADSKHPLTEEQEALIMGFGPESPYNDWTGVLTPEQKDYAMRKMTGNGRQ